ncbi:MAG TPA: cation transporter [Holophagaceae bacterium]|nr:cation transporter [Holophagaceae bacterium]
MDAKLQSRAQALAWITVGWNLLEGVISVAYGAKAESLSLFGFGLDSFVEVGSALMVLWRLRHGGSTFTSPSEWEHAERAIRGGASRERTAAKVIGGLFLLLAASVAYGAAHRLVTREAPDSSVPGLVISLVSLAFMAWLWQAKRRLSTQACSPTLAADAACSLACIQLSVVLLAGSLLFLVAPKLWWADAAASLVLAALIAREGWNIRKAAAREDFDGGCGCH